MRSLTVPAPAKLNLFLHVTGRRPDGYHTLESLFVALDFGDTLTLGVRADGVIVRCSDHPGIPAADDLAVRAAQRAARGHRDAAGRRHRRRQADPAGRRTGRRQLRRGVGAAGAEPALGHGIGTRCAVADRRPARCRRALLPRRHPGDRPRRRRAPDAGHPAVAVGDGLDSRRSRCRRRRSSRPRN